LSSPYISNNSRLDSVRAYAVAGLYKRGIWMNLCVPRMHAYVLTMYTSICDYVIDTLNKIKENQKNYTSKLNIYL